MEPLEQAAEGIAPEVVRNVQAVMTLERVGLEQTPVQERHCSKLSSQLASFRGRLIESAEKEWP